MNVKLRLKRRMSGKRIREDKRHKRLEKTKRPNPSSLYFKNQIVGDKKRDNPNLLTGDQPVKCYRTSNIRVPSKKRKGAWKRFKKSFPFMDVKHGKLRYNEQRAKQFYDSLRSKEKI